MKQLYKYILLAVTIASFAVGAMAQDNSTSISVLRRGGSRDRNKGTNPQTNVTERMQSRMAETPVSDADLSWMRVVYRQLDLTKDKNTPLYFPEEPTEGQESLFRIIMRLLANDQLAAYEYLDGRELFTDQYRIKVRDMLDRFHIYYSDAKGSSEKHPKFTIEESDVPANEVLSYYIIERYEFDNRSNRMRTRIQAICPVLHRTDDFGTEAVKYPMFWIKMDDLRPYLSTQNIFTSDDNNLATCTYDDFFQLGLYEGDIYKTRNLRNKSMAQLYPDPDDLKHAQDSIQQRLDSFGKKLWVPSLEELTAMREAKEQAELEAEEKAAAEEAAANGEEIGNDDQKKNTRRASARRSTPKKDAKAKKKNKPTKVKRAKAPKGAANSGATRSVRNRRK